MLLEQLRRLPPVGESLELGERAEVAQEAAGLVAVAQGQHGVREVVEPRKLLHVAAGLKSHAFMLAC